MKLHLGCYQKKIHGYINVDIRPEVQPDLVDDIFKLLKVKNESAEVIYCCHALEHAEKVEAMGALKRWFDILKPGGVLRLSVPDIEAVCRYYMKTKDLNQIFAFLYGSQRHPFDFHKTGWDYKTLRENLLTVGFRTVQRYDWRETEHFYIDDYSQCYLPQIAYKTRRVTDTIDGELMSLNVEATK